MFLNFTLYNLILHCTRAFPILFILCTYDFFISFSVSYFLVQSRIFAHHFINFPFYYLHDFYFHPFSFPNLSTQSLISPPTFSLTFFHFYICLHTFPSNPHISHNLHISHYSSSPLSLLFPTLSYLNLTHCSLSFSFTVLSLQCASCPSYFFLSLYSLQYLDLSILAHLLCIFCSSLTFTALFIFSAIASVSFHSSTRSIISLSPTFSL